MSADPDIDAIDAELCRINPGRTPLSESAKDAIVSSVMEAPPLSDEQVRRLSRLLGGPTAWRQARASREAA